MKEKLIIKNFGPIKFVELELGRFNVLIGEQATGKSTVAKLISVCRFFSYITGNNYYLFIKESPFYTGLIAWGLNESIKDDTYIQYECVHYSLVVDQQKIEAEGIEHLILKFLLQPKTKEFENLIYELDKIEHNSIYDRNATLNLGIPPSFFQNDVAKVMDNPFYLPAERGLQSIFSLGKTSIQNISDSLFNQFANLDRIARLFKSDTIIEPLDILYKNIDGRGYIKKRKDNQFYSLFNAASGYKSIIPIVLVSKYYIETRKKHKTFIIEEPELDLFPTAQQKLMEFLTDSVMNYGNSVLIETHSPYILTALNNLIYAHKVGQVNKKEVNEIIPQKYWLNPKDLSAYRLLSDGTARNIIDSELEEIAVEELDEAGKQMNAVYDRILDIKFQKDEKS